MTIRNHSSAALALALTMAAHGQQAVQWRVEDGGNGHWWTVENSGGQTHPVCTRLGNGFGLHDMSGNAFEWVNDYMSADYYANSPPTNPTGPPEGSARPARGGSWTFPRLNARSSYRFDGGAGAAFYNFDIGFRVARNP